MEIQLSKIIRHVVRKRDLVRRQLCSIASHFKYNTFQAANQIKLCITFAFHANCINAWAYLQSTNCPAENA